MCESDSITQNPVLLYNILSIFKMKMKVHYDKKQRPEYVYSENEYFQFMSKFLNDFRAFFAGIYKTQQYAESLL
jgi:hypothetical protein